MGYSWLIFISILAANLDAFIAAAPNMNDEQLMCELKNILKDLNHEDRAAVYEQLGLAPPPPSASDHGTNLRATSSTEATNYNGKFDQLLSQLSTIHKPAMVTSTG